MGDPIRSLPMLIPAPNSLVQTVNTKTIDELARDATSLMTITSATRMLRLGLLRNLGLYVLALVVTV